MKATHRDTADFFRFAIQNSNAELQLVHLDDVVRWVDGLILRSIIPPPWMLDLSIANTPDAMIAGLVRVPAPATAFTGISIFLAYLNRIWTRKAITRKDACQLLYRVRDDIRPEHEIAAIRPEVLLDDANDCVSQGVPGPLLLRRVDEALSEILSHYSEFESLIPATSFPLADRPPS